MTVKVFIYTLACPIANKIRYIGKTIQQLEKRLCCHLSTCLKEKSHRANWIKSLRQKGLKPVIELLDVCDENNWKTTESYWIAQFKEWGFNLVNQTLGGDGAHGRVLSEETKGRISLSLIGRKQSEAAVEKRALRLRGRKQKPESIEKSRLSRIGKKLTGEKLRRFQEKIKQRIPYNSKPVFQFTQDGMLIKGFESSAKAGEVLNIDPSSILKCCKGQRKSAHNFIWKFS